MQHDTHDAHHVTPYSVHVKVWLVLLVLTAVTIAVAQVNLGAWNGVVAFLVASVKVGLVLAYFMHLKYEEVLFPVMLGVALLTLVIIFSLTFTDYAFR